MTNYISHGITVTFNSMSGELLDITYGGEQTDMVDVTHQGIVDKVRRFKAGLTDPTEVTLTMHFDPGSTVPARGTQAALKITMPSGATDDFWAQAIPQTTKAFSAPLGDKMMGDVVLKITGPVTLETTTTTTT